MQTIQRKYYLWNNVKLKLNKNEKYKLIELNLYMIRIKNEGLKQGESQVWNLNS
jgi:hypothetical protein